VRVAEKLRGRTVDPPADTKRKSAEQKAAAAKKTLRDAQAQFRKLKLRGTMREAEWRRTIAPLARRLDRRRRVHLGRLRLAVPSPELALGKRPEDSTTGELRELAASLVDAATLDNRIGVDLLAAVAAESLGGQARIEATPFCFTTGSGRQWFLDTPRQLMKLVGPEKVTAALFSPWAYTDDKLSMRWDPVEDRRYALMEQDPTAGDNKPRTVWMANLLAYRALVFFPCAWDGRALATTAWSYDGSSPCFTWPVWEPPLTAHTVRSLLRHPAFGQSDVRASRAELRARGVATIFRCRRIEVGSGTNKKVNFTPAVSP
jgi:hypothetical protein